MNLNESEKLNEATEKVGKLKARIQELVMTMEKVTKNSEMSAQQSVEFVNDLKRTNRYVNIFLLSFYNIRYNFLFLCMILCVILHQNTV